MDYKKSYQMTMLKTELAKAKEDVEQVILFNMHRDDFEQKQKRCAEIIEELRELEHSTQTMA